MSLLVINRTKIGLLELDAAVSEEHGFEVEVTDNKVEVGSDISDHRRVKAATLTISGVISDTPLDPPIGPSTDDLEVTLGRSQVALAELIDMMDSADLLTVVTGIRTYTDVTITNLTIPRDRSTGEALRFSVSFKQIRFATNQVTITNVPLQAKKNLGRQATPEAPEEWFVNDAADSEGLMARLIKEAG